MIKEEIGFEGKLQFDTSMPDGTPRKLLNVDKLKALGWEAKTSLRSGIKKAVAWFLENKVSK